MKNYCFDKDFTFYCIDKTEKGYKVVEVCIAEPQYIHTGNYKSDISKDNDFEVIDEGKFLSAHGQAEQQIRKCFLPH